MSLKDKADATSLSDLVDVLVAEVQDEMPLDRRHSTRRPYFRPVTILVDKDTEPIRPAFVRDISAEGIGLVHNVALQPGKVTVRINRPGGQWVPLRVYITWCNSCGEGWYVSGGPFLGVAEPHEP